MADFAVKGQVLSVELLEDSGFGKNNAYLLCAMPNTLFVEHDKK